MKNDEHFGCDVNPKILKEFLKTFHGYSRREGDTIKAFIENAMKKRIEESKKR